MCKGWGFPRVPPSYDQNFGLTPLYQNLHSLHTNGLMLGTTYRRGTTSQLQMAYNLFGLSMVWNSGTAIFSCGRRASEASKETPFYYLTIRHFVDTKVHFFQERCLTKKTSQLWRTNVYRWIDVGMYQCRDNAIASHVEIWRRFHPSNSCI